MIELGKGGQNVSYEVRFNCETRQSETGSRSLPIEAVGYNPPSDGRFHSEVEMVSSHQKVDGTSKCPTYPGIY